MKNIKAKCTERRTWINVLLIAVVSAVSISGINLHLAAKNMETHVWGLEHGAWYMIHILFGILTLAIVSIHIYQHKNWYINLFKGFSANKKRKRGTIALTMIFALVVVTGLTDWINNVPNSLLGLIHAKIGQLMIIFTLIHIYKRLPYIKESFHKKRKEVEGTPHINLSRCNGCGTCATDCPEGVFEMKELTDKEIDSLNFFGKQNVKYKGRYRSFPTNTNLCIHCGLCMEKCSENVIKFRI
ncbi:MAG: DUF4405 domain-containing protein [Bacteroidales bacterium]|nr:DUF4405 domain-containing protein [Bacteroidales bacterium]